MRSTIQSLIAKGDIHSTHYSSAPAVGRYLGNGRFGSVFSALGLHVHPANKAASDVFGKTQLTHIRHWGRFEFFSERIGADSSADYILPTVRLYWENEPTAVTTYAQTQSFYDGTLNTYFATDNGSVTLTNWFDSINRDLCVFNLDVGGDISPIIVAPETIFCPYDYAYKKNVQQTFDVAQSGDNWVVTIACVSAAPHAICRLYVHSNARIEAHPDGIKITPIAGRNTIAISYGQPVVASEVSASLARTQQYWHEVWEKAAWFDFPEERSQQTWVRSAAYFLSSFNDDGIGFVSTNGLTGNAFPMNFTQDQFYINPVLLAMGQIDVAKAWIETYSRQLDDMRAYAKHLWPEVDGIYPPWELPYGSIKGYHQPSAPIIFCYEPHNVAYLTRMAHDTALAVNDAAWAAAHAVPLIRETALFYRSFCRKEDDGLWHLFLTPSVGQDEAGGRNQADYLCGLYSAKYAFQIAVQHGLDTDGHYQHILDDGLAFASLQSERGFFYASAGAGEKDFGHQKHPVQLNGLAYQAVERQPLPQERAAYAMRYETTKLAKVPHFFGWTLGEFLLSSARIGDAEGWKKDWAQWRPSNNTDENWVQIYESSNATDMPFYLTTNGLVAQSLYSNIVCDYWGKLVIGGNRVYDAPVRFGNFHSVLGVNVSGEINAAGAAIRLQAWKDCTLDVNDIRISLKQDEVREMLLA